MGDLILGIVCVVVLWVAFICHHCRIREAHERIDELEKRLLDRDYDNQEAPNAKD